MTIQQIARLIDLFATSTVFGATIWFFFIQSPALLTQMGREAFVPLQMRLTIILFRMLAVLLVLLTGATLFHSPPLSAVGIWAGIALAGGLINRFVIVPRALKAGGRSRVEVKGKDAEASLTGFAADGTGSRTRLMHRLVVLFVVVMLGGAVGHGMALLQ